MKDHFSLSSIACTSNIKRILHGRTELRNFSLSVAYDINTNEKVPHEPSL